MSECPVIPICLSRQDADFHGTTALKLEACLLEKPARVLLKLFGEGIPLMSALVYDDILRRRDERTTVIESAYGRLLAADLLVWLRADFRQMTESGYGFIPLMPVRETPDFGNVAVKTITTDDLARKDYSAVLERLSAFLPVKELSGVPILRHRFAEFGLLGPKGEECMDLETLL